MMFSRHHHSAAEQETTRFSNSWAKSWAKEENCCLAAAIHQNLPGGPEHNSTVCVAFMAYASHAVEHTVHILSQVHYHGDEAHDPETLVSHARQVDAKIYTNFGVEGLQDHCNLNVWIQRKQANDNH